MRGKIAGGRERGKERDGNGVMGKERTTGGWG